jgi:hypothetical protein
MLSDPADSAGRCVRPRARRALDRRERRRRTAADLRVRAAVGRADDIGAAEDARVRAGDILAFAFVGLCFWICVRSDLRVNSACNLRRVPFLKFFIKVCHRLMHNKPCGIAELNWRCHSNVDSSEIGGGKTAFNSCIEIQTWEHKHTLKS